MSTALAAILAVLRPRLVGRVAPLLVALDGPSGAGKSTLAQTLADALPSAVIIPSDDFYAAHIPAAEWDARSPAERASEAIDWRRLRAEALEPLLASQPTQWYPFDFEAPRPDGTYPLRARLEVREPAQVILLDGAYSSRPELQDLIDLSVLVDVPVAVRHARLAAREPAAFLAEWHARWDDAEAYYFAQVRPPENFDLVVSLW
jgi:uridine kinase